MTAVKAVVPLLDSTFTNSMQQSRSLNSSNGSLSLTDEACATPSTDDISAVEIIRQYAQQREVLEQRVGSGRFEVGDCSNKTRLVRRLGGGTFGEVYLGELVGSGDAVAVKVELNSSWRGRSSHQQLLNEGSVYRKLAGCPGIPDVRWFGMHGAEYSALVMDLLGPTLYAVWAAIGERFSIKTLLMIIDQTVETVGHVHRCGYVHRDISPSNFLLNGSPAADRIQLVDFGQAKRIAAPTGGSGFGPFQVVPASITRRRTIVNRSVVGTPRFASLWSHAGQDASYRDDMESLGYLWIYLARGRLPWQGIRDVSGRAKIERIGQLKASLSVDELCAGLPIEFASYMNYVRSLRPYDVPDHDAIRNLFQALGEQLGVESYDWHFDWSQSSSQASVGIDTTEVKKFFFEPTIEVRVGALENGVNNLSTTSGCENDESSPTTQVSK